MLDRIDVYDSSQSTPRLVGIARFSFRRNTVSTTFTYAESWLQDTQNYQIDPQLPLSLSPSHTSGLPGAFQDSSPDRWGRMLITREQRSKHMDDGLALHKLNDVDFLIGVHDRTREGSLRYGDPDGGFLSQGAPIPPIIQLPSLIHAAHEVAAGEGGLSEIKELLDAGSGSLGGARPKASVQDQEKLFLAKFSHPQDDWDVMAWEKTILDIACNASISVPVSRLIHVGTERVLLLERFDRVDSMAAGARIPYISAMTVLEAQDGEQRDYAEIMEAIPEWTSDPDRNIREMIKRLILFTAIGNTDDHLRNCGFIRIKDNWELAPLFDVNPDPFAGANRVTSILGDTTDKTSGPLKELAMLAGIGSHELSRLADQVLTAVSDWKNIASKNSCPEADIKRFEPIFSERRHVIQDLVMY